MNRILNKRNICLLIVFIFVVSFYSIRSSYAKFEQGFTTDDNVVDYNYDLDFDINPYSEENSVSNIEEYEIVNIKAKSYVIFNIDIKNNNNSLVYYGVWYKILSDVYTDVEVGKYISFADDTTGSLISNETKTTTVIVKNNENVNLKIKIGVASDTESLDNIGYYDDRKPIGDVISNVNSNSVNEPILSGYMIPVSYDVEGHYWVKADYSNKNNSWYNYYDKRWANVVLVKENVRNNYIKANVGERINLEDVLAFYVWIPRFKYLVWDINRQTKLVDDYSYKVRELGIGIIFENDGNNTGNVSCKYNYKSNSLFDECSYFENAVDSSNLNSVYADAWYTHPAFVRNGKNISGFWIGKFETTGSKDNPTIIPDSTSLVDLTMSDYYNVSKKINNYGLKGNLESRIIRNVEWGAVTYLTNSIYGLCDEFGCTDSFINNSYGKYTGRSSGSMINSDVNEYGTYSYDGYEMNGNVKSNNYKASVIASSTSNITGVYDMAGGAFEYVMGNISDNNNLNAGEFSESWKNVEIDNSYFDLYASFNDVSDYYNRARLGDATSEVTIGDLTWGNSMKVNIMEDAVWLARGTGNNIFGYEFVGGGASTNYTFRSVIS